MSKKPSKSNRSKKSNPNPASEHNVTEATHSDQILDLSGFFDEVSERLSVVGSISIAEEQSLQSIEAERIQVMIFKLQETYLAFAIDFIAEIVTDPLITFVPGLPGWLRGVTSLRGEILSVIDTSYFIEDMHDQTNHMVAPGQAKMLMIDIGEQQIGLLIDTIEIIYSLPIDQIIPPGKNDTFVIGLLKYCSGMFEHRENTVYLIDCEKFVLGTEIQQFN